jgi:hypothetical protein
MTTTRTTFTFRVDTWTPNGEGIVEHVARVVAGASNEAVFDTRSKSVRAYGFILLLGFLNWSYQINTFFHGGLELLCRSKAARLLISGKAPATFLAASSLVRRAYCRRATPPR